MCFFFFNDTATTEIYTLSLHDALPISHGALARREAALVRQGAAPRAQARPRDGAGHRPRRGARPGHGGRPLPGRRRGDRKSTRLNSSHANISYAVFCLKKKKKP